MSFPEATSQYFARTPPRASQLAAPGSVAPIAVSVAAGALNLSTTFVQAAGPSSWGTQTNGLCGTRLILEADGADIGIACATNAADVTGANAPSLTAAGSLSTDGNYAYTPPPVGGCFRIFAGTSIEFIPQVGIDVFLAFVGSGNGFLRIYQCSAANA